MYRQYIFSCDRKTRPSKPFLMFLFNIFTRTDIKGISALYKNPESTKRIVSERFRVTNGLEPVFPLSCVKQEVLQTETEMLRHGDFWRQ